MNIRKKIFYMTLLCIACRFVICCKEYDDSGNLIYGFAYNYIQMDSSDPTVCLVFNDCAYDAYLLDETVDLSSDTFDSSFLERKDLLSLDDWQDLPPEIIYDVVHVDSNLVFCRFKQEYQKNKFVLKYDNIRTDVGKWGDGLVLTALNRGHISAAGRCRLIGALRRRHGGRGGLCIDRGRLGLGG